MHLTEGPTTDDGDRDVHLLHEPSGGRLVIQAPSGATAGRILSDILVALGKSRWRAARSQAARLYEEVATVWLLAYDIRDVVLLHADAIQPDAWPVLRRLEPAVGLQILALADPHKLARTRIAMGRSTSVGPMAIPARQYRHSLDGAVDEPRSASREELNAIELGWRREFHRLETEGLHADAYRLGFAGAAALAADDRKTKVLASAALRTILEPYVDRRCLLSAAEGSKVALREYAWHLSIDIDLLSGKPRERTQIERIRHLDVERLVVFADPLDAAALTLAALQLTLHEMLAMLRRDVAPDGSEFHVGRDVVAVPYAGRPLLRAQLIAGSRAGSGEADGFLGRPSTIGIRELQTTVLMGYSVTRIGLTRGELQHRLTRDERWLLDRGVSLERPPEGSHRPARMDGYDPVKWLGMFRAALHSSWRSGAAGNLPCACPALHVPPLPDQLPRWPVQLTHAETDKDHGWLGGPKESGRGKKDRVWESDIAIMRGEFWKELDWE